ncbi:uncharacterized protein LOC121516952 isoform X2 [Cheilinus undulatus]|uniref:uncharacterized protein LOC121516952 isoform X2 n=1 Tax=Cheilinus undulatus TaxID=241271 RepID=UPI001BD280E1|nr:uncharacterized protein LOC121516952 isoform X2 [Cheilinus undulatus]
MKVHKTLICFFFLTLRDGGTAVLHTDIGVRTETEGKNITVACTFTVSGRKRMFCRNDCDEETLVQTDGLRASRGRYSIEYKESVTTIYVSITNLTKSDSGKYKCYLERGLAPDSSDTFELRVIDTTATSKPTVTLQPSSASTTTTSTQRSSSTSGSTTTPSLSSKTTKKSLQQTSGSGHLLYLGLVLLILVIILSVVLLILYRKRTRKPKGPPVQTEYADIQEVNRVYEEIREDRQNRSPVGVSTVYTSATFAKPNNGPTDDYSLIDLPSSHDKTEDDSRNLAYSEINFSDNQAASLNSAPSGGVNNVIYSEPRVEAPLYSTVTSY